MQKLKRSLKCSSNRFADGDSGVLSQLQSQVSFFCLHILVLGSFFNASGVEAKPARDYSVADLSIADKKISIRTLLTTDDSDVLPNIAPGPKIKGEPGGEGVVGPKSPGGRGDPKLNPDVKLNPAVAPSLPSTSNPAVTPNPAGTQQGPTMKAADVTPQFQCPMFSSSPLNDIQNSLNSLKGVLSAAISTPSDCSAETASTLQGRGQKLIGVVREIEKMQEDWGADFATPGQKPRDLYEKRIQSLNAQMKTAIEEAEGIAGFLQTKIINNPKCSRQYSNPEKIIFGVNDLIQGLAPYALQVAGANPAFAPALPYIFGASLLSSGVASLQSVASATKKLDITTEANEKALIQNTCQFIKVYRAVNYLQLSKDRRIEDLNADFAKDRRLYNLSREYQTPELQNILSARRENLRILRQYQDRLQENQAQMGDLETELQADNSPAGYCALGKVIATSTLDAQHFPGTIASDLEAVVGLYGSDFALGLQVVKLKEAQLALESQAKRSKDFSRYDDRDCGVTAQRWYNEIKRALLTTEVLLAKIQSRVEERALQSSEYKTYSYEMGRARNTELNKIRLQKVLEEMDSNPQTAAVIERSQLTEKKNEIVDILFGSEFLTLRDQPVKRWMAFKEEKFRQYRKDFVAAFNEIVWTQRQHAPPLELSTSKKPMSPYQINAAMIQRTKDLNDLKFLTPAVVIPKSGGHVRACQNLEVALGLYNSAVDLLGNIQYMCDMIRPVLYEPKVDSGLKNYCLDLQNYASEVYESAHYKVLIKDLVRFRPQALLVKSKLVELECPKPSE